MKLSIFKRAFNEDINILRISYVIFLITTIIGLFYLGLRKAKQPATSIVENFIQRDNIVENAIFSNISKLDMVNQLREQYCIIAEIKQSHLSMAQDFSSYEYASTGAFVVFSIISAILGFLLLRKGWDNTDNFYLKSSFLVVFFFSTLFGVVPSVYNNKANSKSNLAKYNYFSGLQLDIYELIKDNKGFIKRSTPQSLDSLNIAITAITKGIKENQDLYFDISIEKVPTDIKPFK